MQNKTQLASPLWFILPPAIFLITLGFIYTTGMNQSLFLILNNSFSIFPDNLWASITIFGNGLLVAALLFPFVKKRPDIIWAMVWTAILGSILLNLLKPNLGVMRPPAVLDHNLFHIIGKAYKRKSFPSGHTTTIFNFLTLWILMIQTNWKRWLLLGLALLVGFSRIAVGVHWPADIMAGAALGWLTAVGGILISQKIKIWDSKIFHWILLILLCIATIALIFTKSNYLQVDLFQRAVGVGCLTWGLIFNIKKIRKT